MNDVPINVLLIEDNPGDVRLIQEMLAEGGGVRFKLVCADRLTAGLDRLAANDIGLVLLDLGLPDSQGFDTFAKMNAQVPQVPIIVLSGLTDEELAIKTVQEGAQDYLVKDKLDSDLLVRAIHYAIERKGVEEELRESKERYRALYEDNPSIYFTVDAAGTVLSVNPFGADQLGYTVEELIGQSVLKVFYQDDREAAQQQLMACLQNPRQVAHWEFRKVRQDGSMLWAREAARAVRSHDGNLVVLIVCEDITYPKLMEEALRQSEANLKKAQEVGHVGSWYLDLKKNKFIWSDETCRIFGVPQGTVLTFEEFLEVVHPNERECVDKAWRAGLKKDLYDIEHRIVVNGEVKWVRERAEVELDDKTKGIRATGTVQDITDLKRTEEELKESFEHLRRSLESTVSALASALEMRDPYTAGHQQRVTDLACAIAEEMGLSEEQINGIRMAGLIHDIGKINIPAEILNKPGELTEIEYNLFKNHPQVGHDILKSVEFPWPVAQIVLQHHERMDGSGYPQGLSGDEIMLEARILAVADIVEAIASHRPYRPARGAGDALEEILHNKGTLYDLEVVDACLRVFYEKGFTFERFLHVAPVPRIH
jgi:PAS domain S-box-containing protein/putative nucleotidyltransferase with HDIG domain